VGALTEDDGRKSTIDDNYHLIGQENFNNSDYFSSTTFLHLAIFCCFYLVQDPFTDYLLCVLSNKRVAGHNEKITHENIHTGFV